MTFHTRRAWLAGAATLALAAAARAQAWPARPLRLIVPAPAGSTTDLVARALARRLAAQVGQAVVVENRAGAGGTIAMRALAGSAPDGQTLAFSVTRPLVLSPALGKVPYDPELDFTPLVSVLVSPLLVLATRALAARDLPELLQRARDWPDTVRWASSGPVSLGHLVLEDLQAAARVRMVHVPYKAGGGRQAADAFAGEFEVLSANATPVLMDGVRAGRLRPLAVGAPRRLGGLPHVATLAELGFPRANLFGHFGIFAPGQLPQRLGDRINSEVNAALEVPELRARLAAGAQVPTGGSARDFARQLAAEADATASIVRSAGIRAE